MEEISCNHCGASNASNATFCRACGSKLSKVKRTKFKAEKLCKSFIFASSILLLYWLYALVSPAVHTFHHEKKDYKTGSTYQKINVRYYDPVDIVSGYGNNYFDHQNNKTEEDVHNSALSEYKGKVIPIIIIDGIVLLFSFYFYQRKRNERLGLH